MQSFNAFENDDFRFETGDIVDVGGGWVYRNVDLDLYDQVVGHSDNSDLVIVIDFIKYDGVVFARCITRIGYVMVCARALYEY